MKLPMSSLPAWLLAAAFAAPNAQAQTILRGSELNEKNLVEALSPPPPAEAETESADVVTRSIRVTPNKQAARAPDQSAGKAPVAKTSASVLITFVTNSADLTERARSSLDVVGQALKAERLAAFKFAIEGHADPRGSADDNLRLSQARADSVVAYLAERHQIDRARLQAVGKGDTEVLNTRQIDAPENRRVTIVTLRE